MKLRLISLRYVAPGMCAAEFDAGEDGAISTEFHIDDRDSIATAAPSPDIFMDFDGDADELRQIAAAVIAFCRAAQ